MTVMEQGARLALLDHQHHQWFSPPFTLKHFEWLPGSHGPEVVTGWLNKWAEHLVRVQINQEKGIIPPQPFLLISGPSGSGKTEILARGLGRFAILNWGFKTVRYINWADHILKEFETDKPANGGWQDDMIIIDNFDVGQRPIPTSMNTWVLDRLMVYLEPRGQFATRRPTVIITRRNTGRLLPFLSTAPNGESNDITREAANDVLGLIQKYIYGRSIQVVPATDDCRAIEFDEVNVPIENFEVLF